MKNVAILFFLGLGLQSCNFKDAFVHPLSINDSWKLTEYKRSSDSSWQAVNNSLTVRFKSNGDIKYGKDESYYGLMFLRGGWCNHAEKYTLKDGRIYFEFGKPGCIPIFDPNTPAYGHILKLTKQELVIEWWGESWKFTRI